MIVVTGAAGFIGSYMVGQLNREGFKDIILVDKFDDPTKISNYITKTYSDIIDRDVFFEWLKSNNRHVQFIVHMGARTDTIGQNIEIYQQLNFHYSTQIWNSCIQYGLPLVYASSASTYGDGSLGFDDSHGLVPKLKPLNHYAQSKHDFDRWVLEQADQPFFWAGLKFFNVFGPNEYHKGRMASVAYQAFSSISETGKMKLFRSFKDDIRDGHQSRDFIYVEDIAKVMLFFMNSRKHSGIYNVGTGKSRTYLDLTKAVFKAMDVPEDISFVDTPLDIREGYQYYTCANIGKLRAAGYVDDFISLEDSIKEYVESFLLAELSY